jgi:hypothetical protein
MKVAYTLLSRDKATFYELTTKEHKLWNKFETDDIYRFLTGKPNTVSEFHFYWLTVPIISLGIYYIQCTSSIKNQPAYPGSANSTSIASSKHAFHKFLNDPSQYASLITNTIDLWN